MDTFNPLSNAVAADAVPDPHALEMWLNVNGERRMHAHTSLMIHRIPQLIEAISSKFTLEPGDLSTTCPHRALLATLSHFAFRL